MYQVSENRGGGAVNSVTGGKGRMEIVEEQGDMNLSMVSLG